jgi:ligand-binding sensor domain-containing protein
MKAIVYLLSISVLLASCDWSSEPQPESRTILEGYHITAIDFDGNGNAWLGTLEQGLIKYNGKDITVFNEIEGMIRAVSVDSKNQVYIGAEGLIRYDDEEFTHFDATNGILPDGPVNAIAIDSRDRVWFSVGRFQTGGLGKLDGEVIEIYEPGNSPLPAHWVSAVTINQQDEVWVASQNSVNDTHLSKLDNQGNWALYSREQLGFSPYSITNLHVISSGKVFGGIDYSLSSTYDTSRPSLFTFDESGGQEISTSRSFNTNFIFADRADRIWCAGGIGYGVYENGNWTFDEVTFKETGVFTIAEAPNGDIWLGTGDGVFVMDR